MTIKRKFACMSVLTLAVASCGGAKANQGSVPGQSHNTAVATEQPADDLDTPMDDAVPTFSDAGVDATVAAPPSPVTFVLKNTGDDNLYLNMDKGWQAVIYAYSGTPPNAKAMLMFPTHCTTSCDASPEEICPYCPAPERVKDIKAAEKHEEIVPGDIRAVPWDGVALRYKKAEGISEGQSTRCKCSTTYEPPAEVYTIRACGLRKTQDAKKRSKYQCVENQLTLPVTEPVEVVLDFGIPE